MRANRDSPDYFQILISTGEQNERALTSDQKQQILAILEASDIPLNSTEIGGGMIGRGASGPAEIIQIIHDCLNHIKPLLDEVKTMWLVGSALAKLKAWFKKNKISPLYSQESIKAICLYQLREHVQPEEVTSIKLLSINGGDYNYEGRDCYLVTIESNGGNNFFCFLKPDGTVFNCVKIDQWGKAQSLVFEG